MAHDHGPGVGLMARMHPVLIPVPAELRSLPRLINQQLVIYAACTNLDVLSSIDEDCLVALAVIRPLLCHPVAALGWLPKRHVRRFWLYHVVLIWIPIGYRGLVGLLVRLCLRVVDL